jgi:hypothetical protein
MADLTYLITCDGDQGEATRGALVHAGAEVQATEKHMLDGATVTSWMMVATVAITTAPAFLRALKDLLSRNAVRSITYGDMTITNPRPEHVDQLLKDLQKKQ